MRKSIFQSKEQSRFCTASVLDGLPDGVIIVTIQGVAAYWNSAAVQVLEIREDASFGQKIGDVVVNESFVTQLTQILNKRQYLVFPLSFEVAIGSCRPAVYNTVYYSKTETDEHLLVVTHRQVPPASKHTVSEVVTSLAHQLRAPLSATECWLNVLATGEAFGNIETIRERLGRLKKRTHLLLSLVDDTLFLHQVQNEPSLDVCDCIPVGETVDALIDHFSIVSNERNITVLNEMDAESKNFQMVRRDAEKIITVLLDNAIKYNREHGLVTISGFVQANKLCLSVQDTGIGIEPEAVPHVFSQYFRSDQVKQKKIKGSGLGLSIVKQLVESKGGSVEINSALERGTKISIWYPNSL